MGECSECGLGFEWADLLDPRGLLPGFFEHAWGVWRSFLWAWRTWALAIVPARFWSRVKLHHRVRPWRSLGWLAVVMLPAYAVGPLAANAYSVLRFYQVYPHQWQTTWLADIAGAWLAPVGLLQGPWNGYRNVEFHWYGVLASPMVAIPFAATACFTALMLCVPITRSRAKVRAAHVWRASLTGMAPLALVLTGLSAGPIAALADMIAWHLRMDLEFERALWKVLKWPRDHRTVVAGLLTLWVLWWWWEAISRGFQLPRPARHFLLLMIPSVLAALAVFVYSGELAHVMLYGL